MTTETPSRIRIIEHGIVLQDFSNIVEVETALTVVQQARVFMQSRPRDGSTLILTNVTNSTFNQEVVDALRSMAEHHKPWVRASAIYGLTPLMRIILRATIALTGREIRVFETPAEGMDYLRKFSGPATAGPSSPQKPSIPPGGRR
jgi:hypothetical protein